MHLARFPRVKLFPAPTPLHRLDRLTEYLGGPEIWIKRDDCTMWRPAAIKSANSNG